MSHALIRTRQIASKETQSTSPNAAASMSISISDNMPAPTPRKRGLGARIAIRFSRSKSSSSRKDSADTLSTEDSLEAIKPRSQSDVLRKRLRKAPPRQSSVPVVKLNKSDAVQGGRSRPQAQLDHFPAIDVSQEWERDKQTGERIDHTDMLHSLVSQGSSDSLSARAHLHASEASARAGEWIVSRLFSELWSRVLDHMTPADVASLAFSCKAFRDLLGSETWDALNDPDNYQHKIDFLVHMDKSLPGHLLCFTCATYHVRINPGRETLKPANIHNPLFNCPNSSNQVRKAPRTRLTFGRTLPFTFVQLCLRAHRHSPDHGIPVDSLCRRYKDRDSAWSHQTRYAIVNGHLLLRVVSTCFAAPALPPAGLRHLLYSREDFVPYFSVCAHWRDGELMPLVKCALSHIPKPIEGSGVKRIQDEVRYRLHRPGAIVTLCSECRPMRRCPECPTEYLVEVKIMEDKSDPVNLFKQALVVTRWSDLGNGRSPKSPEWAACNGEDEGFDSFTAIGRRALCGLFEAHYNCDIIPGQKMLSMNPNKENLGEAGHRWY